VDRAQMMVSVMVVGLAAGLVLAATTSPVAAVVACGAAVVFAGLFVVGAYRGAVLLLMAGFAVAPVYRGILPALSEGVTPVDLLMVAGLALMTPILLRGKLRMPLAYVVGVAVLVSFAVASSTVSDAPLESLKLLTNWMLMMVALPVAFALWGPRGTEVTALLWSYVAGQMASVMVGVAEGPLSNDRYDGLTRHPNTFGEAGVTALAITLFLLHRHRGNLRLQSLVVLCSALSLLSIVLSGSRAALVVAAVLVLLVPIVERSAALGFVLAITGALAMMAFALTARFAGEGSAIGRLAGNRTTTGSDRIRADSRDYGWDRFFDHPLLGSGLQGIDLIHDLNLAVLVAVGIFGFVGYLAVMFTFARPLFGDGEFRRLSYVAWSYLGLAPTVPSLWDRTTWVPLALSIVAVVETRRAGRDDEAPALADGQPRSRLTWS
jgi:hypothetical protein